MSTPPLLQMPLHLLTLVLAQLDSIQSLSAAIRSHSSLLAAFNEHRDRVVRAILSNQIPPSLMRYAVPTYFASAPDFDRYDFEKMSSLLSDHYYHDAFAPPTSWHRGSDLPLLYDEYREPVWYDIFAKPGPVDLSFASALSRTHSIIEYFTRDFLRDTLPLVRRHLGLPRRDHTSASADEIYRIHRAMYRFQLYCNLFRSPYTRGQRHREFSAILSVRFFGSFSPWVNEQLACIHDYFELVLSRAFDEVAAHDIQWGAERVDWLATGYWNGRKQAYLLRGLDFLFKVDQAKSYEERRRVLQTSHGPPISTKNMLAGQFCCGSTLLNLDINDWYYFWENSVKHWEENGKPILDWYQNDGPDTCESGPFRMWLEAHRHHWRKDVIYHPLHSWLRRCGYVIWDAPEPPLSDEELQQRFDEARRQSLLNHFRRNDRALRARMKSSWRQRIAIYERGGRGYWSEGNLDRVTWMDGAHQKG